MDASYEQEPFSHAELAAGGIAIAAVTLVAFLAFQRISRPLDLAAAASASTASASTASPPTASPATASPATASPATASPATASPSTATRPPETAALKPAEDLSPPPDLPADNPSAPNPAWPKVLPEAAPAARVKPWAAAISDQRIAVLGPMDPFQRRDFAAASARPEEDVQTPRGATRDPSSPSDALWIQTRLRDLGYYAGSINGVWGPASRRALLDFKTINGLPESDRWDLETEQAVSSRQSVGGRGTFIGIWAKGIEACGRGAVLVIRPRGAKTDGGKCDFRSVKREAATTWQIQADCSAALQPQPDTGPDLSAWIERAVSYLNGNGAAATEERTQRANIGLKLTASRLRWTSEYGAEMYVRCP
jgi:hypothetical protein